MSSLPFSRLACPLALALIGIGSCQRSAPAVTSAEQALEAVKRAAGEKDAAALWELLDQKTRWSVMTTYKARRQLRQLVSKHYTAQRRAVELQRTRLAGNAADARAFFVAYVREGALLGPLGGLRPHGKRTEGSDTVVFGADAGGQRFCRGDDGRWTYCGLREHFERLELRATRDLETVKEGVEFQGGG